MKRSNKKFLAAMLSIAMVLSMAIGVQSVKPAKAMAEGSYTITYSLNTGGSGYAASFASGAFSDAGVNGTQANTIVITGGDNNYTGDFYDIPGLSRGGGYTFKGWKDTATDQRVAYVNDTDPDNPETTYDRVELSAGGSISVEAIWETEEYRVTYVGAEGEYDALADTYSFTELDGTISLPAIRTTVEPAEGYEWKWSDGTNFYGGGAAYSITDKTGDLTFTEEQVPIEYSITYTEPITGSHSHAAEVATSLVGYDAYDITDTGQVTFPTQDNLDDDNEFDLDDGYEFVGWYLNDDPDEEVIASTEGLTGNITLVAKYAAIEYTLTLSGLSGITESSVGALTYQGYDVSNIGTNGTATRTFTVENPISLPIELEIEGKEFVNWTNNSGGAVIEGWDAGDKTGNVNVTAHFADIYTVTYEYGNGTGSDENPTYFLTGAESVTIINPTLDGYDFDTNGKWKIGQTELTPTATTAKSVLSPGSKTYAVSSILAAIGSETSVTFTANYGDAIQYDVIYSEPSTGSHGNADSLQTEWYSVEDLLTLPRANELAIDPGYEFVGWYISGDTEQTIITTTDGLVGDLTLVAKYATIDYDVTLTGLVDITAASATALANVSGTGEGFVIDEFGVGTGTFTVEDLNDQNKLVIPDIEKAGYDFNGWKLGTATAVTSLELTKEQLMAEPTLTADFSEEAYTISLTGIDTSEEIEIVESAGFVVADDQDSTCTTYVKSVTISTTAFHLPDLSDAADEHYYFAGWRVTGTTGDPDDITIEGTVADASYDPVYVEYPKVTATFTLNGGAFTTDDTTKLAEFGYVATSNENIVVHTDEFLSDELEAITPLPAPAKADSIFSGWSLTGFAADDPLVMEYDIMDDMITAAMTGADATFTLTANYVAAPNEGETVVVAEGSARSNIDASKLTEIKSLVESELGTLPSGAIAITKVVVNEESTTAHDGDTLDGTIEATLTGGTVRKAFVDATITTYVTVPGSLNNYSWTHSDLGQVLDITYDSSIVPANVIATDLKMIVREHDTSNGLPHAAVAGNPTASLSYDTFTKLAAQPTVGEEVDGTYWVDPATGDTHVYSSRYSTFAFGYATGGYYVTFNANGGTFSDGTASKQVYDTALPSAPPTATRSGYTLTGWTDSDGHAFEPNATLSGDKVFTAQWQKNSTPPAPGPGGGSGTPSGGSGSGTPATAKPPVASPFVNPSAAPASPKPSASPTVAPTTAPTTGPVKGPAPRGEKITTADGFVITSNGDGTAELNKFKDSGARVLIVDTVTYDGYKYEITSVGAKVITGRTLEKVVIGKNVKKLAVKAFYENPNLGTVIVKSSWLTKKSRVGKNSFGKTKKGIWFKFKLNEKKFRQSKKAFEKRSGARKPRFKRLKK